MSKKIDDNNKKIDELEAKVADLEVQLKRAVADYQNLERRISEGRSEFTNWANRELVLKLLAVLDHLELATQGVGEEEKSSSGWFKGVEMAVKQFKEVLRSEGLEEIGADGQFDPSLHEAVDTRDGDDNMVLEQTKKGYTLQGKVVRPAQVVVGRKKK